MKIDEDSIVTKSGWEQTGVKDESNTVEKEKGLTCPEEARLVEERCVFYESVEAHGI